jgi:hypothetical protein
MVLIGVAGAIVFAFKRPTDAIAQHIVAGEASVPSPRAAVHDKSAREPM